MPPRGLLDTPVPDQSPRDTIALEPTRRGPFIFTRTKKIKRVGCSGRPDTLARRLERGAIPLTETVALGDGAETASISATGTWSGTLPYMPPEQVEGTAVDARSDLYAFGAILYEMATGRRAFRELERKMAFP